MLVEPQLGQCFILTVFITSFLSLCLRIIKGFFRIKPDFIPNLVLDSRQICGRQVERANRLGVEFREIACSPKPKHFLHVISVRSCFVVYSLQKLYHLFAFSFEFCSRDSVLHWTKVIDH